MPRDIMFDIPCRDPEGIYDEKVTLEFTGDFEVTQMVLTYDTLIVTIQQKINSKEQIENIKKKDDEYRNKLGYPRGPIDLD